MEPAALANGLLQNYCSTFLIRASLAQTPATQKKKILGALGKRWTETSAKISGVGPAYAASRRPDVTYRQRQCSATECPDYRRRVPRGCR